MRDQWVGRLQIALAGALWSTSGFFAKSPWFDAWPEESRGLLLAFWRSLFAIPILLPLIRKPVWHPLLIPMMVCFAIMVWSFMTAMVKGRCQRNLAAVFVSGVGDTGQRVDLQTADWTCRSEDVCIFD